ncbi:MAG TPA: MmcQ/YjbR family DNA-binding protein [Acidimicrobiales bacterium]|jgi:hypothetical protein
MRLDEARRFAATFPEVTEEPHFDMSSFRVRGKIFVTVPPDGRHLHVFVDEAEARACAAENPRGFEELWWGKRLAGVRVTLARAPAEVVRELVEDAWRRKAPKRVVAEYDAPAGG